MLLKAVKGGALPWFNLASIFDWQLFLHEGSTVEKLVYGHIIIFL